MSILRIKKGAEINLFLGRSRKKSERKERKKILSAKERRERKCRKRFFPLRVRKEKRVRESAEKDSLC